MNCIESSPSVRGPCLRFARSPSSGGSSGHWGRRCSWWSRRRRRSAASDRPGCSPERLCPENVFRLKEGPLRTGPLNLSECSPVVAPPENNILGPKWRKNATAYCRSVIFAPSQCSIWVGYVLVGTESSNHRHISSIDCSLGGKKIVKNPLSFYKIISIMFKCIVPCEWKKYK